MHFLIQNAEQMQVTFEHKNESLLKNSDIHISINDVVNLTTPCKKPSEIIISQKSLMLYILYQSSNVTITILLLLCYWQYIIDDVAVILAMNSLIDLLGIYLRSCEVIYLIESPSDKINVVKDSEDYGFYWPFYLLHYTFELMWGILLMYFVSYYYSDIPHYINLYAIYVSSTKTILMILMLLFWSGYAKFPQCLLADIKVIK